MIADRFLKIKKIGRGGFGDVFLAEDTKEHKNIALKKIRIRVTKNGLDFYALEEIKQLQEISHPNIVELVGVFRKKKALFIGFELLSHDLEKILDKKTKKTLTMPEIKYTFKALMNGLAYLHSNNIIHRDIKPGNIMYTNSGIAKIIDFGLSCEIPSENDMISQATTLPYRAPELLYGAKSYGTQIDIWSAGCLLFELLTGKVLFDGINDFAMLKMIALTFGPIEWPGCTNIDAYIKVKPVGEVVPLHEKLKGFPSDAIDLVEKCVCLDPKKRITANEALKHPFLSDSTDCVVFP